MYSKCALKHLNDNRHLIFLFRLPEHRSPRGSHNGYSDVNNLGYYELQEALTSRPNTNCISVFDAELFLASFAAPTFPRPVTLCGQVMLWMFSNVFHICRFKSPSMTYAFHYLPVRAATCQGINCISCYVLLPLPCC